ncbi:ABC transporter ATP-binding protein [Azospirillum sp.]|uniref:ABC transporter ATP-binding protein n=1 Tax=Azospirillum sp. TaxID=34012 RepID=UPI003D764427
MSTPKPGGIARLYATFWHHTAGARGLLATFLALLFVAQVVRLAIPWFFGEAVNALQDAAAQDLRTAGGYMAATLGAAVLAWALHGPGRVIERFVAVRARARFADALYARLTALPLGWHERHHSGETIQRMGKATTALFGFAQHQFVYLQNVVSVIGPIAALFVVSTATGAVALAGYAAVVAVLVRFDGTMVRLLEQENRAERRYVAELVDCLGNIATVLTLRLQAATRRVVGERLAAVFVPLRRHVVVNEAKWCAIDLANNALRTGLVVLYAWLAWREGGVVPLGTAVMVHQYAQQIGTVVSSMATHWQELVRHTADVAGADAILDARPRPGAGAAPLPEDWRAIAVHGLEFRYGARAALSGVELDLVRGERVALVGESGSGKSTLLRVLSGLYEAERIAVRVDGAERADLRDLGGIATLVPQDPEIFESSIRQNITMGIDYAEAEVLRACRLAQLLPVVERLPAGLDTVISERGLNLSGGQKQRLALARGILASRASSLIMLDEPTSSMDPSTELTVYRGLLGEFPDACVVSAVHRLHLLTHFDRVVLMADGRRVDAGTLDELLARQPTFQAMWGHYHGASAA